jgi:protein-disulfide isomerase
MILMAEENKSQGKTIVLNKKLVIAIASLIVLLAIWFLLFNRGKGEYISSDSPILGNLNASVSVIEFSDYECPFCQAAEGANQEAISSLKQSNPNWEAPIPKVIEEYVNTGKVRLVFRQFPVHGNRYPALASKCAQEQGKFWEYQKILFENYNALENTDLKKYAVDLNLSASQFNECFDSGKYMESIQNDLNDGQGLGVDGTPTFFVGNIETGYEKIVGANSFSVFKEIIDSKL